MHWVIWGLDTIIKFSLYDTFCRLSESKNRIEWPGTLDDYIAFFVGYQANEVSSLIYLEVSG